MLFRSNFSKFFQKNFRKISKIFSSNKHSGTPPDLTKHSPPPPQPHHLLVDLRVCQEKSWNALRGRQELFGALTTCPKVGRAGFGTSGKYSVSLPPAASAFSPLQQVSRSKTHPLGIKIFKNLFFRKLVPRGFSTMGSPNVWVPHPQKLRASGKILKKIIKIFQKIIFSNNTS